MNTSAERLQYAALPYRLHANDIQVLLITSRETCRWVVPKGWPIEGRTPSAAAAQEALEEAGVVGRISKNALGSYRYSKRLQSGRTVSCAVDVFPMHVRRQRKTWPEQNDRTVKWFSVGQAARSVDEPELRRLIRMLKSIISN